MTGLNGRTTAGILFFGPHLLPPASEHYGAKTTGFKLSRILQYPTDHDEGKLWQLRTVCFRGERFIAPFVLNTGGVEGPMPIVGTPLLRKIGAIPQGIDRIAWKNYETTSVGGQGAPLVTVPSPLGRLGELQDWDMDRGTSLNIDERYNLIGHGFAFFIRDVQVWAGAVVDGIITFDAAVERLISKCDPGLVPYIQNPVNRVRVQRELRATIDALQTDSSMAALAMDWAMR